MNTNPSTLLRTGVLYYGDNLKILREYIPDESVDLIYLDPPFNSQANYNVLFKEPTGEQSAVQVQAFTDTWHWDDAASGAYAEIQAVAPEKAAKAVEALRQLVGRNDMMAYLVMMAARLLELYRALKPTGSLYLHCDPTASHYLKVVLDSIFGPRNFRNEIVWKRTSAHSDSKQGSRHYGRIQDSILFYIKSSGYKWNQQYGPYNEDYVEAFYRHIEAGTGRRYRLGDLTARKPGGDTEYEWKGVRPYKGRYWAYSRAKMEEFESQGRLVYAKSGMPQYKRYLDEMSGMPVQSVWEDIRPAGGNERLGYATQKPLALLERIISASSNEGDVVLDPFCGCGTAVVAAQRLNRRWIGIDVTHLAITVMKKRLEDGFPGIKYQVVGEPTDLSGARALADQDRYQFQWWALGLVGALPAGERKKKGADQGVDGIIAVHTDHKGGVLRVPVQVKSGHVNDGLIRDLKGVVGDGMGIFVTLERPSQPMITTASQAGLYYAPLMEQYYPRIQMLTIEELLGGKSPQLPPRVVGPKAPLVGQAVQQGVLT